ncbi:DUF6503 family protein [Longibacter salinarum]|uniref:DUF6503 family protein n=1 Tax=Longibacter salinarum TaxID=1850348 RepID=UPI001FE54A91|nr:DUF6503 family protein [Longibacter salinarum]
MTAFLVVGCGSESTSPTSNDRDAISADSIIQKAIAAHGGSVLDTSVVTFDFRGAQFRLVHDEGRFRYVRRTTDSLGQTVREVLSNDSLYREVNGDTVSLSAEERESMNTTVNSVSYFALLPYKLSDPAVNAQRLGVDTVRSTPYYRVEVTFASEGGGQDWEDRFVYWFDTESYHMDFLAYAYGLGGDEEPGHRFREAYNVREIENVRIADYKNYTDTTITPSTIENYARRLSASTLQEVSRVELDSVRVTTLRDGR